MTSATSAERRRRWFRLRRSASLRREEPALGQAPEARGLNETRSLPLLVDLIPFDGFDVTPDSTPSDATSLREKLSSMNRQFEVLVRPLPSVHKPKKLAPT